MTDDALARLRQQLDELENAPLSSHPEVLEGVHRALVEELDALADIDASQVTGGPVRPGDAAEEGDVPR